MIAGGRLSRWPGRAEQILAVDETTIHRSQRREQQRKSARKAAKKKAARARELKSDPDGLDGEQGSASDDDSPTIGRKKKGEDCEPAWTRLTAAVWLGADTLCEGSLAARTAHL